MNKKKPKGLPDAFILRRKNLLVKDNVALILGDNFFYGQSLTKKLKIVNLKEGAKSFLHPVKNPRIYGVATINNKKKVTKLGKTKKTKSNLCYNRSLFFDNKVIKYSKSLKPSKRNELEITDLLNLYKKKNKLKAEFIGRGGTWLDTGSIEDFYNASNFVSTIENRQGLKIACIEEISLNNKWITKKDMLNSIKFYGKCDYSNYLKF